MTTHMLDLVIHTHANLGRPNYPGSLNRLHRSIIGRTLDRLRHAPPAKGDRFRRFSAQGLIAVAGMPVHVSRLVLPALAGCSRNRTGVPG
jgi:hypothetical protein